VKPLRHLLRGIPLVATTGDLTTAITGITADSRLVRPGDLFVALRGKQFDGHDFVDRAVALGAAAIVCEPPHRITVPVPVAITGDTKAALGRLSSAFYDHPSKKLQLIGVTGTDGKTSTTMLTAAVLRAAGVKTGHCTTIELYDGRASEPNRAGFTTPQPPELQAFLARCADAGCQAVVTEVSSHALAMGRVEGCEFDIAVFTNLAPEHLDFHRTMEEYREQKARLFEGVRTGVINGDDPQADFFAARCKQTLFYGFQETSGIRATDILCTSEGSAFRLQTAPGRLAGETTVPGSAGILPAGAIGEIPVNTRLLGRFNVRNWLAAAGAGLACGATLSAVAQAAARTPPVPGRMDRIDAGQPFSVYVDFAHTPQALATALDTIRELHPAGRVAAVYGHAGGRDPNHRRGLVEATKGRADLSILTMDDPYQEDPSAILDQMRLAARDLGVPFEPILDRREAFKRAFEWARTDDTVLLAGRGHETVIVVGSTQMEFHDPTVAKGLLAAQSQGLDPGQA